MSCLISAAVAGSADGIVTMNAKDFPRNILAEEGLARADPYTLLLGFFEAQPEVMRSACDAVLAEASAEVEKILDREGLLAK